MIRKTLTLFIIGFCLTTYTFAQTFDENNPTNPYLNTITTAVPFLQIAPDSYSGGLGDQGVATPVNANSQAHNPSKYVFSNNIFGFSISYSPWLKGLVSDINLAYLAAYWKLTEMDALAFSLRYFSLGDIQLTDYYGQPIANRKPNEFALDFTYNRKLTKNFAMALTGRFIYSNLANDIEVGGSNMKPGLAGAADLSLFYQDNFRVRGLENTTLRFGLALTNVGNKVSYSDGSMTRNFLPTNLKLGLSYTMDFDGYNKLTVTGELGKLLVPTPPVVLKDSLGTPIYDEAGNYVYYGNGIDLDDISVFRGILRSFYDAPGGFVEEMREISGSIGLEYSYRDLFFVRTGVFLENAYKGNRKFIQVGAGVKYNIFAIDVCYLFPFTQRHPMENTLRFSITFDFESFNSEAIKRQGKLR